MNAFEERVLDEAILFVASSFRGRATYERREATTLEEVLALAPEVCEAGRAAAIYAIAPNGASAMVGTWTS